MYFDPTTVPDEEFSLIPDGWQRVMIDSAEGKETKAGNGRYISVAMHVADGPHEGRKIFDIMLVNHANETAQKIGLQKLKKLLFACGHTAAVQTEAELLSILRDQVLFAEVTTEKGKDGETRNKVKKYAAELPADASVPVATPGLDDIPF